MRAVWTLGAVTLISVGIVAFIHQSQQLEREARCQLRPPRPRSVRAIQLTA